MVLWLLYLALSERKSTAWRLELPYSLRLQRRNEVSQLWCPLHAHTPEILKPQITV
jgi:hypothetical protein